MQQFKKIAETPVLKIELSGEIDSGNAEEFYRCFTECYTSAVDVEFSCSTLEFIDSTTLGTFVKIFKRVKTAGCAMRITGLPPRIKKLFVICSLDTIMEIS